MTPKYVRSAPKINLITSMRGRCFSSTYFYLRFSLCSSYLRFNVRNIARSVCPTYVNYYRSYGGSTTHTSTVRRVRHSLSFLLSHLSPLCKGKEKRGAIKNFDVANTIALPQAVAVIPISNQQTDFNFYYHPSRHCENVNMLVILPRRDLDTTGDFISSFLSYFFTSCIIF